MKRNTRTISLGLCATILFTSSPYAIADVQERPKHPQPSYTSNVDYTNTEEDVFSSSPQRLSTVAKNHAYIPRDTQFTVELTSELSSKKARKGDIVPLKLSHNVIINGVVVIPEGATVRATVVEAKSAGMFGRSGKLGFTIDSVRTINGIDIPLAYTAARESGSADGAVAVVAFVSIIGGMFMNGKNVSFPAGTTFDARVTADTDLHVSLDDLADAMSPNRPHGVTITLK